ncbi:N-fatty-acyl-amino acid synthase/hydrolase PM20D1 isoform X2 [Pteronotus mesoamericanus]|uniref:N-fatty-acyl-amino acid synthase/hydrolase PM20D1 isoform X2 n=1 Tax=Pteronotus mesoamericanus TaxID=1884717 RepID=UPI0023ECA9ED|nr:N-fatty-acyl-amino acid synthase/hydrolase PM20D1 isoform X2 [Pteronotus parnellii mesoamericanus]
MALRYVCVLVLAAVLLLGVVSTPKGLKDKEPQRAPRIPPHFSQEESFRMKETLKGAIQIPTVSFSPGESNVTALAEFGEYIYKAFPTVFKTGFIQHEVVGEYSHLFTVQGSDPSLQPYMLLSHIDVVPAPEQGWEVPPFSGLEHDGFIYGRGTLDNKNSAMAILQALELLLIRNYIPRRSFYISLGHDEEVSGTNGAQKISALLQARGVQLAFIVDECGFILDGFIPSITKPFAFVSVSEKGSLNLILQVNMTPGHSSAPPKETSIGILAAAVSRLERATMPSMFGSEPLRMTLQQLANEFSFPTNIIMNNLWLFGPLVRRSMESEPITNALVRTTMAVTMFQAGIKVLELAKNIVADDRVQFHVLNTFDPMPPSPYDDQALGYQLIRQTLQSLFPEVSIVPGICIGQTDSRHYSNLTSGIYRFNPLYAQPQDFRSIHGINEKISVKVYRTQVKFIFEFIQNADADQRPVSHLHEL